MESVRRWDGDLKAAKRSNQRGPMSGAEVPLLKKSLYIRGY